MAFEQKPNSGVLFKNLDKQEGDKFPHAKGRAKIGGIEYWVNAWTKLDKNNQKYQTLSFMPMDRQEHPRDSGDQRRMPPQRQEQAQPPIQEDGIPFDLAR